MSRYPLAFAIGLLALLPLLRQGGSSIQARLNDNLEVLADQVSEVRKQGQLVVWSLRCRHVKIQRRAVVGGLGVLGNFEAVLEKSQITSLRWAEALEPLYQRYADLPLKLVELRIHCMESHRELECRELTGRRGRPAQLSEVRIDNHLTFRSADWNLPEGILTGIGADGKPLTLKL